jgi:DNA-binding transcriptional LysR family regulator
MHSPESRAPDLRAMSAFVAVAERKSFARAAAELGLSRSALSETIRALETRLGVRLLNRTTRSVSATEAGERLLARLRPVLDDYQAAIHSIGGFREKPAGTLRLTVPPPAALPLLGPLVARFLAEHPAIQLEISASGALVDIVAERFDAGIRPGERLQRDMIAIRLIKELHPVIVAAPSYIARRGRPAAPADLHRHDCIRIRLPSGAFLPWTFEKKGKRLEATVEGSLIVDESTLALRAAVDGVGLVQATRENAGDEIAAGRLAAVLEDWAPRSAGLYLYHPSRRQMPPALQAFIAFLRTHLKP